MPNTDAPHGFGAHAPFYGMEEFETDAAEAVSYTHLTLPTTPYV